MTYKKKACIEDNLSVQRQSDKPQLDQALG